MFPGVPGGFVLWQHAWRHQLKDFYVHAWRNWTCKLRVWSLMFSFSFVARFCTGSCSEVEAIQYQPVKIQISNTEQQRFAKDRSSTNLEFLCAKYCTRIMLRNKFRLWMLWGIISSVACGTLNKGWFRRAVGHGSLSLPLISALLVPLAAHSPTPPCV